MIPARLLPETLSHSLAKISSSSPAGPISFLQSLLLVSASVLPWLPISSLWCGEHWSQAPKGWCVSITSPGADLAGSDWIEYLVTLCPCLFLMKERRSSWVCVYWKSHWIFLPVKQVDAVIALELNCMQGDMIAQRNVRSFVQHLHLHSAAPEPRGWSQDWGQCLGKHFQPILVHQFKPLHTVAFRVWCFNLLSVWVNLRSLTFIFLLFWPCAFYGL